MALPVVFVHGVPEDATLWDGVREHITDRETRALNLPGFGTPIPSDFSATKEAYLAWLVRELENVPKPFDLVGHDWGGILVDRVVFTRPDLMHTFASDTISVSSGKYEWHDLAKVWQTPGAGEAFMQANASRPVAERAARLVAAGMTPEYASHVAHPDPVRDDCILRLYRSAPNVSAEWKTDVAPAVPGLFIGGATDPYGSHTASRAFAQSLGMQTHTFEGVGHWWMLHEPARAAEVLRAFWGAAEG
jgi:pimeloyl-ACP methyl ester carboxylesterase